MPYIVIDNYCLIKSVRVDCYSDSNILWTGPFSHQGQNI